MYHNNEFFCLCLLWLLISTQKCQVAVAPGCRSRYEGNDNTQVHFFAFPDAEKYSDERVRWINKVPRLNWNPGKKTNIKLCHKHFRLMISHTRVTTKEESVLYRYNDHG